MQVNVMVFGQLTDLTGESNISLTDVGDTDGVLQILTERYPALAKAKFRVALNKQLTNGNTQLKEGSTVALLPPFSGG